MTNLSTHFLELLAQRCREEAARLRQAPGDATDKANAEKAASRLEYIAEGAEQP